jgi:23S rRNA (uracil1939-C5)-methyltransferase
MQNIENCSYYGVCGGCKLYELNYNEQLKYKQKNIFDLFSKIDESLIENIEIPLASPEIYRYRNKVEFTFFQKEDETVGLGFHQKGHYNRFVDIDDCLLMNEENALILKYLKEWVNSNNLSAYDKKNHKGLLRYLIIRNSKKNGNILVTLVVNGEFSNVFLPLIEKLLKQKLSITGFIIVNHSGKADCAKVDNYTLLYGNDYLLDSIGDKNFIIPFDSFFQVNNYASKLLYDKILSFVKQGDHIIDLYCGAGTISTYISDKAKYILGIEIIPSAVLQAKKNMSLNNVQTEANFIAGRVREKLSEIRFENDYNLVIIDPPRSGTDKKTMAHIGKRNPERIIYIACGLNELAYNLKIILEYGYIIKDISSVDMFPWTPHVEIIILLEKLTPR